jgi:hypothetical protein
MSAAAKSAGTAAKRARSQREIVPEDDELLELAVAPAAAPAALSECPTTMEAEDFVGLARLKEVFAHNPQFRLLPMPAEAYTALKLVPPSVVNVAELSQNCFSKTMRERYTNTEIEVHDLRLTHTAADFPVFYEGPAHPHMQPEGGARVIVHEPTPIASPADADGDDGMGVEGSVLQAASGGAGASAVPLQRSVATTLARQRDVMQLLMAQDAGAAGAGAGAGAGAW